MPNQKTNPLWNLPHQGRLSPEIARLHETPKEPPQQLSAQGTKLNIPEYVPSEGGDLADYFPGDVLAAVGGMPEYEKQVSSKQTARN